MMQDERAKIASMSEEDKEIYLKHKEEMAKEKEEKRLEWKKEERKRKSELGIDSIAYKHVEYPYIDEVDKKELESKKHIFIDPGKRTLLHMIDD